VVFINGSILPNGERRDFFNLMSMQRALEIVFAQSCLREFAVLMCEIIDDECTATNAVIKRSFSWTSFYTAIPWIGHRASLTDAAKHEFIQPPDGAFDFLKRADVIDIQESWRFNAKVRALLVMLTCLDFPSTRLRRVGVQCPRSYYPWNHGNLSALQSGIRVGYAWCQAQRPLPAL
jgi:hypothetical protein